MIAGREDALVVVAVDEGVRRVAVGADGGGLVDAELVLQLFAAGAPPRRRAHGFVEGSGDVVHLEGDVLHAVAMLDEPLRLGMLARERRDEHERDLPLPQDVARLVLMFGFEAGVGDDVEAEGVAIEVRRLPGVADEEADVVDAA